MSNRSFRKISIKIIISNSIFFTSQQKDIHIRGSRVTSFLFRDYSRKPRGRKTNLHCVLVIVRDITANEFVISGGLVSVRSLCKV